MACARVYPFRWNIGKAHLVVSPSEKPCAPSGKGKGMASYHCTVKVGGKGKAAAHAAYISREGKYSGRERYEDLEATGQGNLPKWAEHNPAHFWNAADEHERANGATYREIEVALPRDLDPAQRRALVEGFIQQEIGDRHAYQWAIHTPTAALDKGEQPHAHILYSERTLDGIERDPEQYFKRYNAKTPERGGCRKDSAGTEDRLQATRQRWADVQNAHLERHGIEARVDHRSLKERGIERDPEKHLGGRGVRRMQAPDITALLERRAAEGERERAQRQVSVIDLSGDLAAAKAERDQRERQPAPEVKRSAAAGVADFRAQFEAHKLAEAGKRQARAAFEQFKAERERQRQAEQARQQATERELAHQREEAGRKRQAEIARQQPKRERSNDGPEL